MYAHSLLWPTKEPDEVLDYQIDATSKIADSVDTISSASVAVAPSGPGEMIPMQIMVTGSFVTVWLGGGIPARVYQVKVQVTTGASRVYEWPIVIQISNDLAIYPITPPASQGFGPTVVWYS